MKILKQLSIILAINLLGELVHLLFNLPIPGNVLGMIFLLILLCSGILKLDMIEKVSDFLLKNLAFFFIPAGVGLISCLSVLSDAWFTILLICIISTVIVILVTGITIQLLKRS